VDWCESHKLDVIRVNVLGVLNLADLCHERHIHVTNFGKVLLSLSVTQLMTKRRVAFTSMIRSTPLALGVGSQRKKSPISMDPFMHTPRQWLKIY